MRFPQIVTYLLPSHPVHFSSLCDCHHCRKFFPALVTPPPPYLACFFFILFSTHLISTLLSRMDHPPCLNSGFMRARLPLCCSRLCLQWQEQILVNGRYSINICYVNVCNWHPGHFEIHTSFLFGMHPELDFSYASMHAFIHWKNSSVGILICRLAMGIQREQWPPVISCLPSICFPSLLVKTLQFSLGTDLLHLCLKSLESGWRWHVFIATSQNIRYPWLQWLVVIHM